MSEDLVHQLVEALRNEQEALQAFDEAAAGVLGINLTDLRCLGILERRGSTPASELAAESGLTSGSMTALVDRLERAGYVRRVRDAQDRRRVFIELTERAGNAIGAIWGPLGREGGAVAGRYTAEELGVITDYLRASGELLARHSERLKAMPRF